MRLNHLLFPLLFLFLTHPLLAQVSQPLQITRTYLQENIDQLKLTEEDITDYAVSKQLVSKHNKVTHLYLLQQHQGIEVYNAMINVNIQDNGEVLNLGNRFVPDLANRINTTQPVLSMQEALQSFIIKMNIPLNEPLAFNIIERISDKEAFFDPSDVALDPIRVKLIYQPLNDKSVRLAWNIELYERSGQHWWNARIDATNGALLDYFDQTVHCQFEHQGHCEETSVPHMSTQMEQNLSQGNSSYNVYPLTIESPNHGDRALIIDPADPTASPLGWHDTDGEEGPEFTITRGNNVHAYHDIFDLNGSYNDEPDGGDTLCFDFDLDLSSNTPYTQLNPIITNLFYWNNLMHDVWYQYGFDEPSGNFQFNNYGNGGFGDDHVNAEALDGSGTNNANFSTPPDGDNPRMQMFLWGGDLPTFDEPTLEVTAPEEVAGFYEFRQGNFGGDLPFEEEAIVSEVILVDDGTDVTSDACESIVNGAELEGKIALIDRGSCEFGFKCLAAEDQGAIAVIVCNNVDDNTITMAPGQVGDQVTIPAILMSLQDCNEIKMGLPGLTVKLFRSELEVPQPGPTGRSSDLDNGVIVHEYTHGISIRLTGGANTSSCLSSDEQAGEGWSDWFALVMTTTPDMNGEMARGIGTYASGQPPTGGGIRTHPYSRNMNINPHTYADINGESIPHGVGSVWCVMIWDLFWNLVDEYGYDEDIYFGTGGNNIAMQLVVDGLKLQSCNPSFVNARNAILIADQVNNDGANKCLIWETFAKRGLGASALPGGQEAFDLPDECNFTFRVNKTAVREANAGDVITYELEIINGRMEAVENAVVTDELPEGTTFLGSDDCDASEDNGLLTIDLGTMESGTSINCSYQVQLAAAPFTYTTFEDGVENGAGNWNFENPIGAASWELSSVNTNSGNFSFFAPDIDSESDQYLIIAQPQNLNGPNPALAFWHFYDTETNWDGGVVEISVNGSNWEDLGDHMIQNGYNGPVQDNPASPISGRPAFHGNSGDWIQTIIDLGDFVGDQVLIRFRMACDGAVGGLGWYVDDVQFFGDFYTITNTACVQDEDIERCSDMTTIVVGEITGTREIVQEIGLSLFPNPTQKEFTILPDNPINGQVVLRVKGIDGRLLFQKRYQNLQRQIIDMAPYGTGVYLIELRTSKGITTRKLIVQ